MAIVCIFMVDSNTSQAKIDKLPNILHIHADDHRPDGLHALDNPLFIMPNLDSLVERGIIFTHCYTMGSMIGAVCTPSRTMQLTGRSWQRIPGASDAMSSAADPSRYPLLNPQNGLHHPAENET